MSTLPPIAEMERAYVTKDAAYNGLFIMGVRTTGIFCRPSCPARTPYPENVEYFPSPAEALFAGYRPCKRCRPMAIDDQPEWAARLLADVERNPAARITEANLRARGIDPATVRRHFVRHYGMTFQAYARARRLSHVSAGVHEGHSVDDMVFASGYQSHSGFREAFGKVFGCSPREARDCPPVTLCWMPSPLGPLVAGATDQGICLLEYADQRRLPAQVEAIGRLFGTAVVPGTNEHLQWLEDELAHYFAGTLQKFSVRLVFSGTPFQRQVWEQLLRVPYGVTCSYQELATAVGNPAAVRAVGRANGQNRIAIMVPCHRIVNKNGDLGGYGGGLRRKQYLLNLEQVGVAELATPRAATGSHR